MPSDDATERNVAAATVLPAHFAVSSAGPPHTGVADRRVVVLSELVAGGGLGLLVGFLLGLSVAQVVGGVIAALAALLGAFLGLSGAQTQNRAWRIGAFGLLCAIGVALGLAVRAGNLLSPSVSGDVGAWTMAGYPAAEARSYVAYQRLGVKPETMTLTAPPAPTARSSALFAGTSSVCNELEGMSVPAQLEILHRHGGVWAGLAAAAAASTNPSPSLTAGIKAICG